MANSIRPPSNSLTIRDKDDEQYDLEEGKCGGLTVALCPCLVCFILLFIVVTIVLIVKFHLLCHTPLHSVLYKKRC